MIVAHFLLDANFYRFASRTAFSISEKSAGFSLRNVLAFSRHCPSFVSPNE